MLNEILNFLNGKKTYILGAMAIGVGIYFQDLDTVMMGLIAMGLRAGIAKN